MTVTITSILIPIMTAVLGSYLTYYFLTKSKKNEAILRFKEEKYSKLLLFLQGFVGSSTASGEMMRRFFEERRQSWLYCSDEVVHAINEMIQLIIDAHGKGKDPEPQKGRNAVGKIVLEMRKDLLGKTKLKSGDFTLNDFSK